MIECKKCKKVWDDLYGSEEMQSCCPNCGELKEKKEELRYTAGKWEVDVYFPNINVKTDKVRVAEIYGNIGEVRSNAILISKAPEMYEILKDLYNEYLDKRHYKGFGLKPLIATKKLLDGIEEEFNK